jgi:hypothetical protein
MDGHGSEAADRVLRARFWTHRDLPGVAEVVDLASRRRESLTRED